MMGDEAEGYGVDQWCAWYGVTTSHISHCIGEPLQALPAALLPVVVCLDVP